jgi:hypothetical protein
MANTPEQIEHMAKTRAVKGWTSKELPKAESHAILRFLNGGPCPKEYKHAYMLCRVELGLPAVDEPKQFERDHAAIHEAVPGTCIPCDKVYDWKENEENA